MAESFHHETFSHNGDVEDVEDDLDSLFGGSDDELASLLIEAAAVEPLPLPLPLPSPSQKSDCETASPPSQERPQKAANPAAQLLFPEFQPRDDYRRRPSLAKLSLPAVPDPLGASLSHRGGHTSGDLVVSTQDSDHNPPVFGLTTSSVEESFDGAALEAALEAELHSLWESIASNDQLVNAHAVSQESDAIQDDSVIPVTQIPGFRYAQSETHRYLHLPRRVDLDQKQAEELMHTVTLNRRTPFDAIYNQLELNCAEGKRLMKEIKAALKVPPLSHFAEQHLSNGVLDTKRTLIRIAFYMLITEEWGTTWFGDNSKTAQPRTLFWPTDSSILMVSFSMLVYRLLENERQTRRSSLRAKSRSQANSSPPPSPSRSPSVSLVSPPESPPPINEGQLFFASLVDNVTAAKKRKHAESVLGIPSQNPIELDIPANARLTYHVYVKDKTDGSDLGPPATYQHTDSIIAGGAFSYLRSAFHSAGHEPILEIQTPFGRKAITSIEDWEGAVLGIYNVRRSGGVVEVDVFV